MGKNMYDEKGFLKPEYMLTDAQKRELYLTDWGKGIQYFTCDSNEVATPEEVEAYNKRYWENMIKNPITYENDIDPTKKKR